MRANSYPLYRIHRCQNRKERRKNHRREKKYLLSKERLRQEGELSPILFAVFLDAKIVKNAEKITDDLYRI